MEKISALRNDEGLISYFPGRRLIEPFNKSKTTRITKKVRGDFTACHEHAQEDLESGMFRPRHSALSPQIIG
jgi:hypothetical protein